MKLIHTLNEFYIHDDSTDLIYATANGDLLKIQRLMERGVSPDIQGPKGWTALRRAAIENRCEAAALLLKHGAAVDAVNASGLTALMIASAHGHHEMVSLLISHGADPDIADQSGRTSLMIAAEYGYAIVVGVLLDKTAFLDINKTDIFGKTAFQFAIESGHDAVVKMLNAVSASPHFTMYALTATHRYAISGGVL
jgi:ankyrin repeat protein